MGVKIPCFFKFFYTRSSFFCFIKSLFYDKVKIMNRSQGMSLLKKTVSMIAILSAVPSAFAVTARPSVIGTASSRLPSMVGTVVSTGNTNSPNTTTWTDAECIDAYTECLKGGNACGPNFEECTNNTLFYAKKPQCASTLTQCPTAGVNKLFGTNNQTAFSDKNSAGEYIYPKAGSVLGQLIEAASINNRYDTSECVRAYTSCLKRDDVCGYDFELCTTNTEFKKQRLFCESTLARCQDDGVKELFGSTNKSATPTTKSRVGIMIKEGQELAAVNAVATCYKVVDQCFLNSCALNPYKCVEGSNVALSKAAENVGKENAVPEQQELFATSYGTTDRREVKGYLQNSCLDTIGTNKYCYATFVGNGSMPTSSQLQDEIVKQEVFENAYTARMNESMRYKLSELIKTFDKKVKDQCAETIMTCAMRTCGEGSGPACYAQSFASGAKIQGVTNPKSKAEIKTGCEAIVNNDTACQYAGATINNVTGALIFAENSLFDKLFTSADEGVTNPDPVGAVGMLNARLSTSYNQAALDNMKKQCETVTSNCVRSMCGADFVNCYRNRTDIYSSLTQTNSADFNQSMNKVGGVLDYTIVLGLCLDTVKNTPVCQEHINAEVARQKANTSSADSWGSATSARQGWLDAGVYTADEMETSVQAEDENGQPLCTNAAGDECVCGTVEGCNEPKMITTREYQISQAERTIFRDLVYDIEKEAQAKYNAKLTKQQNMCMSSNSGGIMGNRDLAGTFLWVKLNSNKVPNNYATAGLKDTQFKASNELYGSFCRIRITIQSDDRALQQYIQENNPKWATAYFAAGDAFTCGSWIPVADLEEISEEIVGEKAKDAKAATQSRNLQNWLTALGSVSGALGGAYLGSGIQNGDIFSGLTNKKNAKTPEEYAENCKKTAELALESLERNELQSAKSYGERAVNFAKEADVPVTGINSSLNKLTGDFTTTVEANGVRKTEINEQARAAAINDAQTKLEGLKNQCDNYIYDDTKDDRNHKLATGLGAGAGAIIGGVLTYNIIDDVWEDEINAAGRAAATEWMDSVGKHIRCYIGGEEVGNYGDMISTSME